MPPTSAVLVERVDTYEPTSPSYSPTSPSYNPTSPASPVLSVASPGATSPQSQILQARADVMQLQAQLEQAQGRQLLLHLSATDSCPWDTWRRMAIDNLEAWSHRVEKQLKLLVKFDADNKPLHCHPEHTGVGTGGMIWRLCVPSPPHRLASSHWHDLGRCRLMVQTPTGEHGPPFWIDLRNRCWCPYVVEDPKPIVGRGRYAPESRETIERRGHGELINDDDSETEESVEADSDEEDSDEQELTPAQVEALNRAESARDRERWRQAVDDAVRETATAATTEEAADAELPPDASLDAEVLEYVDETDSENEDDPPALTDDTPLTTPDGLALYSERRARALNSALETLGVPFIASLPTCCGRAKACGPFCSG